MTQVYDYDRMTNYLKTYVKILVMPLLFNKALLISTLLNLHVSVIEVNYRSFFHYVDLMRMGVSWNLGLLRIVAIALAAIVIAVYVLAIYSYWQDGIELIELMLVNMVAVLGYFFVIVVFLAWRKRAFSGCTYLTKESRERVKAFRRKIYGVHMGLVAYFIIPLVMIWYGNFKTLDLTVYITGTTIASSNF